MPIFYQRKSVSSLSDLKPGDHIKAENSSQSPGWGKWTVNKVTLGFFSGPATSTVVSGHHMMVVRPVSKDRVRIIHMTDEGVKEEDIVLNPRDVMLLAYDSPVGGIKAIENARECYDDVYDPLYSNDEHFVIKAKGITYETGSNDAAGNEEAECEGTPQEVRALNELQMGDHIREESNPTHHLLVVKILDASRLQVIHKLNPNGVVEEIKSYQPSQIKVIRYKCYYAKETIVRRAREMPYEAYHARKSNDEQFVIQARTGEKSIELAKKKDDGGMWAKALQE